MNLALDLSNYSSITCNSKEVKEASIFVCIKGNNLDGHQYIEQAANAGASLIVISSDFQKTEPTLLESLKSSHPDLEFMVSVDTRLSLAELSSRFYGEPSKHLDVYAVTGTNGKTTVTHLIQEIFDEPGCALLGTIGVRYKSTDKYIELGNTTPQSNLIQEELSKAVNQGLSKLTMEVSSHALDQKRCYGIEFKHSIVTNLTQDHLDYHHNMEEYMYAKAEIFKQTKLSAILNPDNEYFQRFKTEALKSNLDIWTFGINSEELDLKAINIKISPLGLQYHLAMSERLKDFYLKNAERSGALLNVSSRTELTDYLTLNHIELKLNGTFNIYNSLSAFLLAILEGVSLEKIYQTAPNLKAVPGRFETLTKAGKPLCIVDYAHSPDGLVNILNGARDLIKNSAYERLVCVFGCGGDRDITKRPKMGRIAYDLADFIYVTSDNPRSEQPRQIIADILAGIPDLDRVEVIESRADAIKKAVTNANEKDLVVIAGKGHEDYQILKDKTIHFDDREHVRAALET